MSLGNAIGKHVGSGHGDDSDGVHVDEFCGAMVTNVDVLGHVRVHGVICEFDLIVFIHSSGSFLAMVNILEQLAKVNGTLSYTSWGGRFSFGGG
jgi:hypothetical protein